MKNKDDNPADDNSINTNEIFRIRIIINLSFINESNIQAYRKRIYIRKHM